MTTEEQIIKSSEDFVKSLGKIIEITATSIYKEEGKEAVSTYLHYIAKLSCNEIIKYLHGLPFHHYAVSNKLNWPECGIGTLQRYMK